MRKAFIVILFIAASASAQRLTPQTCRVCGQPQRVWYAEEKPDWNHALAELVEYGGNSKYYAVPLGTPDGHWIVIWETVGFDYGGYPWRVEPFDSALAASIRYEVLAGQSVIRKISTEPTGKVLVIYKCSPGLPCGI